MNISILTRFYDQDYIPFYNHMLYGYVRQQLSKNGLAQAMDDSKRGVLSIFEWSDIIKPFIFVSGLPSPRRDRLGTPIRYNLVIADDISSLRQWTNFFIWLFQNAEQLTNFVSTLDDVLAVNNELPEDVPPANIIIDAINSFKNKHNDYIDLIGNENYSYIIYSAFVRDNVSLVSEVLAEEAPAGILWYDGKTLQIPEKKKIYPQKVTKKYPYHLIGGCLFLILLFLIFIRAILLDQDTKNSPVPSEKKSSESCQGGDINKTAANLSNGNLGCAQSTPTDNTANLESTSGNISVNPESTSGNNTGTQSKRNNAGSGRLKDKIHNKK
ncbi:MAG: hypothetical protein LBR11_00200 [Deltaproteobacteria bacterium]|jgi:hypothetical protein|nr:hypothetical protein [Deltaproteobacteria bacterium]